MEILITGATGFIGKHLLDRLIERDTTIHALVRPESKPKWEALVADRWPEAGERLRVLEGDLSKSRLGVSPADLERLKGRIESIFHLAAIYDIEASPEEMMRANIEGTRHAVQLANTLSARLHYASSVAVAGWFNGVFHEEMFNVGQSFPNAYFESKYEAEKLVRAECEAPYRIYRPGAVIGHSQTGEADRIDGPYYAFKMIKKLRDALPPWLPLLGYEGAQAPVVPVDYVARAMDCLSQMEALDGEVFHLLDPNPPTTGEMINAFCRAAGAPRFTARLDNNLFKLLPTNLIGMIGKLAIMRTLKRELFEGMSIPEAVFDLVRWPAKFDTARTRKLLEPQGVVCPPLNTYAGRIWDHWARNMDPQRLETQTLEKTLAGRRIVVTGASSGIGLTVARKIARSGGIPLLVARSEEKLLSLQREIREAGGKAHVHPADLSDEADCDRLVAELLERHGAVEGLINNAGRSIRRTLAESYDRYHDFTRTMQLNYFGSLKLILGLLPIMRERGLGYIVNVSSIGVQTNAPRFGAYVASKAALDAFSRSMASEVVGDGVHVSTVYMPLVRTPMIAPTKIYEHVPAMTPDEAADLILEAMVAKKKKVATRLGTFGEVAYAIAPKLVDWILSLGYRLFPDSSGKGSGGKSELSDEAMVFAYLLRGLHW